MCRVIAVANQKGRYVPVAHVQRGPERKRRRVGKTTTCVNLGIGLARAGKKVLLVEADAQGSMAVSLGIAEPNVIYVKNFIIRQTEDKERREKQGGTPVNAQNGENHNSRVVKTTIQESLESQFKNFQNHNIMILILTRLILVILNLVKPSVARRILTILNQVCLLSILILSCPIYLSQAQRRM